MEDPGWPDADPLPKRGQALSVVSWDDGVGIRCFTLLPHLNVVQSYWSTMVEKLEALEEEYTDDIYL